jgi:hypothetical protein
VFLRSSNKTTESLPYTNLMYGYRSGRFFDLMHDNFSFERVVCISRVGFENNSGFHNFGVFVVHKHARVGVFLVNSIEPIFIVVSTHDN